MNTGRLVSDNSSSVKALAALSAVGSLMFLAFGVRNHNPSQILAGGVPLALLGVMFLVASLQMKKREENNKAPDPEAAPERSTIHASPSGPAHITTLNMS